MKTWFLIGKLGKLDPMDPMEKTYPPNFRPRRSWIFAQAKRPREDPIDQSHTISWWVPQSVSVAGGSRTVEPS